jgi:phosphate transport system permease protein
VQKVQREAAPAHRRPARPPERRPLTASRPIGAARLRLRPRDFGLCDIGLLAASVVSSLAVVWILFDQLTLLSGPFGFIVVSLVVFLLLYWFVNLLVGGRRLAADRLVAALVTIGALCMFTPLALLVVFLFVKGLPLLSMHLLTSTQKGVPEICVPHLPCPKPGVLHAVVGTLEQTALAVLIGVPAGVLTAVYLNEAPGRFASWVRVVVTAMSGLPAILAGMFIYAFWIVSFHQGFSGLAGAMALAMILLPIVTRGTEEVLRIVPNDLREASTALGSPQWRTVFKVVLPTARSGLVTAVLLSIAVSLGETAPLLLTIFGNTALNADPFHGPQAALPLVIFTEVKSPRQTDINLAYAAALVLFLMIFLIFILARLLASTWLGNRLRSQRNRRLIRRSTRTDHAGEPAR